MTSALPLVSRGGCEGCRRSQPQRQSPMQALNVGCASARPYGGLRFVRGLNRLAIRQRKLGPALTSLEEPATATPENDEWLKNELSLHRRATYLKGALLTNDFRSMQLESDIYVDARSPNLPSNLEVLSPVSDQALNVGRPTAAFSSARNGTLIVPMTYVSKALEMPNADRPDTFSWPSSGDKLQSFTATIEDVSDMLAPAMKKRENASKAASELKIAEAETPTALSTIEGPTATTASAEPAVPKSIVTISIVSMMLTMASCVFNTLLPIYMVTELKMSMRSMGMFEGMLEAFSYFVRMFSGVMSDVLASRKATITLGFGMSALAKFGMTAAGCVPHLFMCKAIDRLANGVQAAPRDALIGDLAPVASRSACFGFAQSLRKWGSTVAALLAFCLMKASNNNYQLIFIMASVVSLGSCIAFALVVPDHQAPATTAAASGKPAVAKSKTLSLPQLWSDVKNMGSNFYRMLAVVSLYGLGHINESLLEARAIEVGFSKAASTLVVAALCFTVFLCAYPLGKLDDKYGSRTTFAVGMAALIVGDLILLASSQYPMAVFLACIFWGIHWAVVQGPLLSMVVNLSPPNLRGTAFGVFYTVMAFTAMLANTVYGHLWHSYSATTAFGASAVMVAITLVALPSLLPQQDQLKPQLATAAA